MKSANLKNIFLTMLFVCRSSFGWDGYDYDNSTYVEMEEKTKTLNAAYEKIKKVGVNYE